MKRRFDPEREALVNAYTYNTIPAAWLAGVPEICMDGDGYGEILDMDTGKVVTVELVRIEMLPNEPRSYWRAEEWQGPPVATYADQVQAALYLLRRARDLTAAAGATRSTDRIRSAIKSTEGALRHAALREISIGGRKP